LGGATVTLSIADKGFSRTVQTNDSGAYNFAAVPPDTYSIEVEKSGFKKSIQTNVIAPVGKPVEVNVNLNNHSGLCGDFQWWL